MSSNSGVEKQVKYYYYDTGLKNGYYVFEDGKTYPSGDGIGIDLGIKDLAICSNGNKHQNINKTQRVKKLDKRKRKLQRSISRKYEKK